MSTEPKPPNKEGSTMCTIRWMVELPGGGWLGAWDKESFDAYRLQELAAERERIKARLLGMHDAVRGHHNYYAHAALVIFGEKD